MGVAHHVVGKPRLPQPKRVTPILWYQFIFIIGRDRTMITMSQTKSANYLFIVAVLKSMREGGVITLAEYERAKRYYQKLTGSDLVIAD